MDEQLVDLYPLLRGIAKAVAEQHDLSSEELFLEARLMALEAIRTFDPEKCKPSGTLLGWVKRIVTQQLFRKAKYPGFREKYGRGGHALPRFLKAVEFNLHKLLCDVSEDAAQVIIITIKEWPNSKQVIKDILRGLGWSRKRTQAVFTEIGEAL